MGKRCESRSNFDRTQGKKGKIVQRKVGMKVELEEGELVETKNKEHKTANKNVGLDGWMDGLCNIADF